MVGVLARIEAGESAWKDEVEAARRKIPPDADLAALVKKAVDGMSLSDDDFEAETHAAFGLWLDRDPAAALAWLGLTNCDRSMYPLGSELERWMVAGGYRQLQDYIDRCPLAAGLLKEAADRLASERGPDLALEIGAVLKDPLDRCNLFANSFDEPEEFTGRLARLRSVMNEWEAQSFLRGTLSQTLPTAALLEEIRTAGFPPAALAKYEEWFTEASKPEPLEPEPDPSAVATIPRFEIRSADQDVAEIGSFVPGFMEWHEAVKNGRMAPGELFSRVREAWPEAAGKEQNIRRVIARAAIPADPVGALRWLREAGTEEEWRKGLSGELSGINPEQIAAVLADLPPGTELTEDSRNDITRDLASWRQSDPEGYAAAMQGMAGDDRNRVFAGLMQNASEADTEGSP